MTPMAADSASRKTLSLATLRPAPLAHAVVHFSMGAGISRGDQRIESSSTLAFAMPSTVKFFGNLHFTRKNASANFSGRIWTDCIMAQQSENQALASDRMPKRM
jgi:hypothetical protein